MPGPYAFPVDRVTGGPAPATDFNALAAAFNEATPLATPNVLALRDAAGRLQAEDPAAAEDVATKGWVEGRPTAQPGIGEFVGRAAGGASARWNIVPASSSNMSLGGQTADMSVCPVPIYGPCRLRSFTFQVTTAGDAGSLVHWWLYEPSGAYGSIPDTLVQAFAGVSGAATGNVTITPTTPIDLDPGYYMFLVGGSNVTTTAPGITGANSTMGQELMYRTRNFDRPDLMVRGGTKASGINTGSAAPATIAWSYTAANPNLYEVSGGRLPLILLDLIPAA